MSQVLEQIKSRRSIRKYKPDEVPQELLDQIIEAGLYAASGKGQQSAIIIQVTNKKLRDEISRMNAQIMGQPCQSCLGRKIGPPMWPTAAR